MESSVQIVCFVACYAVALVLELVRLTRTLRFQRAGEIVAAAIGLIAHTWYLGQRVALHPATPLASQQEWFLLAAWGMALVYLVSKFYMPGKSLGLFLLPGVLALVGASTLASAEPLAAADGARVWGTIHGGFLLLGTLSVLIGFLSGVMYLLQNRRLKRKLPLSSSLPLPSLEWLEATNSRSLGAATLLICCGFLTGVITRLSQQGTAGHYRWTDPVVLSLGAMTLWLLVAEVFRIVYPAARQGRKVAYLTMAAFVFLLLVFAAITWGDQFHQQRLQVTGPSSRVQHVPDQSAIRHVTDRGSGVSVSAVQQRPRHVHGLRSYHVTAGGVT